MKTKDFLGMLLMAFLAVAGLTACSEDNEGGRKITDYKEYTLTVASVKLPGVVTSCGNNVFTDVYAVKKSNPPNGSHREASAILNTKKGMNTKYVSVKRATWIIAWVNRHGLNTSCWKSYRKNIGTPKICLLISFRIGILSNAVRISIRNLLMPSRPTKKRTLRMTLKPMLPTNLEASAIIYLLLWQTTGFYWMTTCTLLNRAF